MQLTCLTCTITLDGIRKGDYCSNHCEDIAVAVYLESNGNKKMNRETFRSYHDAVELKRNSKKRFKTYESIE